MTNPQNTLIILDSSIPSQEFEKIIKIDSKIIAADYETHVKLKVHNVDHDLLEDYLEKNERMKLYDFVISKYNWYEKVPINYNLKFEKINILSLMSSLEFHEFVLSSLIKLFSIKNLLKINNFDTIHASKKFKEIIVLADKEIRIKIIHSEAYENKGFLNDDIELKFNLFSKPIVFYISKKNYTFMKKLYENFLCKINNLWLNKKTKQDILLLLEFNTSTYAELIRTLSKSKMQLVMLNNRRSAIWNKKSIKILKSNNVKILNPDFFLNNESKKKISVKYKFLNENLEKLWNSKELIDIFSIDGISFWSVIQDRFKKIYDYRLEEYIKLILESKYILNDLNIKKIISLNESGETENIMLQTMNSDIDSILLQHSFLRYNDDLNETQWRYEDQFMIGLKSKKFFIWGNSDLNFFLNMSKIKKEQLIISGSPRHDTFSQTNSLSIDNNVKNILVTLSPISERSGLGDTQLIIKYNIFLNKIIKFLQTFDYNKIIIKLHPGENPHNSILLNYLKKYQE